MFFSIPHFGQMTFTWLVWSTKTCCITYPLSIICLSERTSATTFKNFVSHPNTMPCTYEAFRVHRAPITGPMFYSDRQRRRVVFSASAEKQHILTLNAKRFQRDKETISFKSKVCYILDFTHIKDFFLLILKSANIVQNFWIIQNTKRIFFRVYCDHSS